MAELDALLDQAGEALLRGELAALPSLTAEIERAAEALSDDPELLVRLRAKSERNGRLTEAAARGVRSARARLAEIASAPVLTTYDAAGRRAAIGLLGEAAPKRL